MFADWRCAHDLELANRSLRDTSATVPVRCSGSAWLPSASVESLSVRGTSMTLTLEVYAGVGE